MELMLGELYDALKEAGASEVSARSAATAVASYENRFHKIDGELVVNEAAFSLVSDTARVMVNSSHSPRHRASQMDGRPTVRRRTRHIGDAVSSVR